MAVRGFVYFIRGGDYIKIGWAKDVKKRMAHLQIGSPSTLYLLGFMHGSIYYEKHLHEHFKAHRVHGEWFNSHPEIVTFINERANRAAAPLVRMTARARLKGLLLDAGLTVGGFAAILNTTSARVVEILDGDEPTKREMRGIERATGGAITARDMLYEHDKAA